MNGQRPHKASLKSFRDTLMQRTAGIGKILFNIALNGLAVPRFKTFQQLAVLAYDDF